MTCKANLSGTSLFATAGMELMWQHALQIRASSPAEKLCSVNRRDVIWGQDGFEEALVLPLGRMVYGEVGHTYIALSRPDGACLTGKLANTLKFTVKEIDPSTGEHLTPL